MNLSSLRYLLLKLYFPAAFLLAIILLISDAATPPVIGQRIVTVTVYLTVVQTVAIPVYVPVTVYVPVMSVFTSLMTLTTTAVSVSLESLTLWNTVTTVTTAMGVFGAIPGMIFGAYSDAGIFAMGTVAGTLALGLYQQATDTLSQGLTSATDSEKKAKEKVKRDMGK
jgi:hypothetical protein